MIRRLWAMRPWRHRYEAVIIGRESGNVTALPFVRFRSLARGYMWVTVMNDRAPNDQDPLRAARNRPAPLLRGTTAMRFVYAAARFGAPVLLGIICAALTDPFWLVFPLMVVVYGWGAWMGDHAARSICGCHDDDGRGGPDDDDDDDPDPTGPDDGGRLFTLADWDSDRFRLTKVDRARYGPPVKVI